MAANPSVQPRGPEAEEFLSRIGEADREFHRREIMPKTQFGEPIDPEKAAYMLQKLEEAEYLERISEKRWRKLKPFSLGKYQLDSFLKLFWGKKDPNNYRDPEEYSDVWQTA